MPSVGAESADGPVRRPPVETAVGEFGHHTVASTLKAKSLFKNHLHKHIDQIDGNSFADRLVRPGEPIKTVIQHDTELPANVQEDYDDFLHSWKKNQKFRLNNELDTIDEDRQRKTMSQ